MPWLHLLSLLPWPGPSLPPEPWTALLPTPSHPCFLTELPKMSVSFSPSSGRLAGPGGMVAGPRGGLPSFWWPWAVEPDPLVIRLTQFAQTPRDLTLVSPRRLPGNLWGPGARGISQNTAEADGLVPTPVDAGAPTRHIALWGQLEGPEEHARRGDARYCPHATKGFPRAQGPGGGGRGHASWSLIQERASRLSSVFQNGTGCVGVGAVLRGE